MEAASPEFAAMWATQDVALPAHYTRMVVYTPADSATRAAMERLVAAQESEHFFPCWSAHAARTLDLVPQQI